MKKRTIISIQEYQPEFDFEEAEHVQPSDRVAHRLRPRDVGPDEVVLDDVGA